jgi:WD40 repeat protein
LNANLWTSNGAARFSPDGRFLLTWERVPILHVWDPESGRLLHTLKHNERVEYAAFNPAVPNVAATGGRDNTIRVWDLDNGKLLVQLHQPRWAAGLAFSPDGSELITGCSDGLIRSWDWRTARLNRGLPHNPTMLSFDFTADRRVLVVQSSSPLEVTHWPSGTPLGPASRPRDTIYWGLVIPAGDRRAIVGGFAGTIVGYDLERMLTPTTASVDEMIRLAELAAGRRVMSAGNVVPITSAEWAERWEQLRRTEGAHSEKPSATSATDRARP